MPDHLAACIFPLRNAGPFPLVLPAPFPAQAVWDFLHNADVIFSHVVGDNIAAVLGRAAAIAEMHNWACTAGEDSILADIAQTATHSFHVLEQLPHASFRLRPSLHLTSVCVDNYKDIVGAIDLNMVQHMGETDAEPADVLF